MFNPMSIGSQYSRSIFKFGYIVSTYLRCNREAACLPGFFCFVALLLAMTRG